MSAVRELSDQPTGPVSPPGRREVVRRAWRQAKKDAIGTLAGGVAFYGFLAIFPALIALVSLFGLVADRARAAVALEVLTAAVPASARPLVAEQLASVLATSTAGLTVGLVVSAAVALFSASSGTQNLLAAVNVAYAGDGSRSAVRLRLLAFALTVGAVLFVVLAVALVAAAPFVLDRLGVVGWLLGQVARWTLLEVLMLGALAVVYRTAPECGAPRRWVTFGSVVATLSWTVGSVLFGLYVENLGSYQETYGTLAGVVVLLLWLHLTSWVVLLGAEIDAEAARNGPGPSYPSYRSSGIP